MQLNLFSEDLSCNVLLRAPANGLTQGEFIFRCRNYTHIFPPMANVTSMNCKLSLVTTSPNYLL